MKKWILLILALMLCLPALAETPATPAALPVKLLEHDEARHDLTYALTEARSAVGQLPAQMMIRAELAEMSTGAKAWFVTLFDTETFLNAWCVTVDASTGVVISLEAAQEGFFPQTYAAWTAEKGLHALWPMEDKQLYDALYAMLPSYGLPQSGDMSAQEALNRALFVLGLSGTEGYEVGYGYLTGGEGYNGVWEICLVKDGAEAYRVNLDAVSGEVYYMEPDEAGNG